ncbi:MAG TPA: lysylphosphatidylglycerol synthase domain-containing protein [Solirubrobacter sp.]|nr:lysylphosphatidylglycerol synthase domain-containing protein [Solirubrobacter sp.]
MSDAIEDAVAGLVDAFTGVAPGWLALGVLAHLLNQVARGRGWYAVVRAAAPRAGAAAVDDTPRDAASPRQRDAIAAWVAGAGAGGIVSARGGDAVRVLVLARRAPRAGCALLTGTLVAEAVGECALGFALLALALAIGVGPQVAAPPPAALYAAAAFALLAAATALAVWARRRRAARDDAAAPPPSGAGRVLAAAHRAGRGCAGALRDPRRYAREVLPWQLASRVLRLVALACFLTAFGLPATLPAVLLVVFAQTSGRLLPFSPASVGAGAAILAATLNPVTHAHTKPADVAAFFVGTSTVLTVVGTALALAICAQASVNARAILSVGRTRIRPATAPRP